MSKDVASERMILQLRVVLRGISPLIWRRLLVPSDTSIAQLHEVLQVAFGWEDMHLHRFEIRGREYGLSRDGGCRHPSNLSFCTFIDVTCSFKGVTGGFHFLPVGRGRLLAMLEAGSHTRPSRCVTQELVRR
jgi:hypothetical protein